MKAFFQRICGAYGGIFIIFLLFIACGCNPEAFVKPINPSSRHFTVREDGDTIKVRFGTDDWSVTSVILDGKTIEWIGGSSALESIDGKRKITSDGFIMYYKKSGERELELFFLPNFSDSEMNISVEVSNSFECDTLTFKQSRCSGYEFESIIWGDVKRLHPEYEKGWGPLSFKNDGTDTLRISRRVFFGASRQVSFSDENGLARHRKDLMVQVPDGALDNESLSFNDHCSVLYSYDTIEYPLKDETEVVMRFPPTGKFSWYYNMLWYIDTYSADYSMSLRNVATGRIIQVKGILTSKSPNGHFTFYYEKRSIMKNDER
jgi:hypothetical protein